jgi:hypothetical protein
MLTMDNVKTAFRALEVGGYRPPDIYQEPGAFKEACNLWTLLLPDMTSEDLMLAVASYIRSGAEWWPKPGQILALVPARRIAALDDADAAWGELVYLAGRHGSYSPPSPDGWHLSSAAMEAGLRACGGWAAVCISTAQDHVSMRASFRAAYRAHGQRQAIADESGNLIMLSDHLGDKIKRIGMGGR